MSPDSFDAYIGTGTGVKQLAFANGVNFHKLLALRLLLVIVVPWMLSRF